MKTSDDPPVGWVSLSGVLEPDGSVAAFAARGQAVTGVCNSKGCKRRVTLEPKPLCGAGLGRLTMEQVKRLYRCARLDGCGLDYHNEPVLIPLRLDMFVGKPNVRVRVRCRGNGCTFFRTYRVEQMVAGLRQRGQGDDRTEVGALGKKMTGPCPLCRKVNWTAEVLWVNMDTQGWKALGERSFDRKEYG